MSDPEQPLETDAPEKAQGATPAEGIATSLRQPLTDREKAQIRFLLRALAMIVAFVIVFSLIVGAGLALFG